MGSGLHRSITRPPGRVTAESIGREDARIGSVLTPFRSISALSYVHFGGGPFVARASVWVVAEPPRSASSRQERRAGLRPPFQSELGRRRRGDARARILGQRERSPTTSCCRSARARTSRWSGTDWAADAVQPASESSGSVDAKPHPHPVTLGGDLVRRQTPGTTRSRGRRRRTVRSLLWRLPREHLRHLLLVDHAVSGLYDYVGYRGACRADGATPYGSADVLIRAEPPATNTYEINLNLVLS